MRRPRFTVRRLMIAVAVVGFSIGGWLEVKRLDRLSGQFQWRAWNCRLKEDAERMTRQALLRARRRSISQRSLVEVAGHGVILGMTEEGLAAMDREVDRTSRRIEHWRTMADKYERAARDPWLPVAPDPPEPE